MDSKNLFERNKELEKELETNNIIIYEKTPVDYIEIRNNSIYFELLNEDFDFDLEKGPNWVEVNFKYVGSDE